MEAAQELSRHEPGHAQDRADHDPPSGGRPRLRACDDQNVDDYYPPPGATAHVLETSPRSERIDRPAPQAAGLFHMRPSQTDKDPAMTILAIAKPMTAERAGHNRWRPSHVAR